MDQPNQQAADQERVLIERLHELAAPFDHAAAAPAAATTTDAAQRRRTWYADASTFLHERAEGHWWCRHARVMAGFLGVLERRDAPAVKRLAEAADAQTAGCARCAASYRDERAREWAALRRRRRDRRRGEEAGEDSEPPADRARRRGLAALARGDAPRLAPLLERVASAAEANSELPAFAHSALWEALSYARPVLDDARCADALGACVRAVGRERAVALLSSSGGGGSEGDAPPPPAATSSAASYPGLIVLLTHADPAIRSAAGQWAAPGVGVVAAAAAAAAAAPDGAIAQRGGSSWRRNLWPGLRPALQRWADVLDGGRKQQRQRRAENEGEDEDDGSDSESGDDDADAPSPPTTQWPRAAVFSALLATLRMCVSGGSGGEDDDAPLHALCRAAPRLAGRLLLSCARQAAELEHAPAQSRGGAEARQALGCLSILLQPPHGPRWWREAQRLEEEEEQATASGATAAAACPSSRLPSLDHLVSALVAATWRMSDEATLRALVDALSAAGACAAFGAIVGSSGTAAGSPAAVRPPATCPAAQAAVSHLCRALPESAACPPAVRRGSVAAGLRVVEAGLLLRRAGGAAAAAAAAATHDPAALSPEAWVPAALSVLGGEATAATAQQQHAARRLLAAALEADAAVLALALASASASAAASRPPALPMQQPSLLRQPPPHAGAKDTAPGRLGRARASEPPEASLARCCSPALWAAVAGTGDAALSAMLLAAAAHCQSPAAASAAAPSPGFSASAAWSVPAAAFSGWLARSLRTEAGATHLQLCAERGRWFQVAGGAASGGGSGGGSGGDSGGESGASPVDASAARDACEHAAARLALSDGAALRGAARRAILACGGGQGGSSQGGGGSAFADPSAGDGWDAAALERIFVCRPPTTARLLVQAVDKALVVQEEQDEAGAASSDAAAVVGRLSADPSRSAAALEAARALIVAADAADAADAYEIEQQRSTQDGPGPLEASGARALAARLWRAVLLPCVRAAPAVLLSSSSSAAVQWCADLLHLLPAAWPYAGDGGGLAAGASPPPLGPFLVPLLTLWPRALAPRGSSSNGAAEPPPHPLLRPWLDALSNTLAIAARLREQQQGSAAADASLRPPPEALAAARRLLAPGDSAADGGSPAAPALPSAALMVLGGLFPDVAPGNLGVVAALGAGGGGASLAPWPSRKRGADDEEEMEVEEQQPAAKKPQHQHPLARRRPTPPPPPPPPPAPRQQQLGGAYDPIAEMLRRAEAEEAAAEPQQTVRDALLGRSNRPAGDEGGGRPPPPSFVDAAGPRGWQQQQQRTSGAPYAPLPGLAVQQPRHQAPGGRAGGAAAEAAARRRAEDEAKVRAREQQAALDRDYKQALRRGEEAARRERERAEREERERRRRREEAARMEEEKQAAEGGGGAGGGRYRVLVPGGAVPPPPPPPRRSQALLQAADDPPLRMEDVHADILALDYYRDVVPAADDDDEDDDEEEEEEEQGAPKQKRRQRAAWARAAADAAARRLQGLRVPERFRGPGAYCQAFRRLLMEEVRATLEQALCGDGGGGNSEQQQQQLGNAIASLAAGGSIQAASYALEIESVQRQSVLHVVRARVLLPSAAASGRPPPAQGAAPRTDDLLLLTEHPDEGAAAAAAPRARFGSPAGSSPAQRLLALVTDVEMLYGAAASTARGAASAASALVTLRVRVSSQEGGGRAATTQGRDAAAVWEKELLLPKARLRASGVASLTTQMREFSALAAVQQAPAWLRQELLSPLARVRGGSSGGAAAEDEGDDGDAAAAAQGALGPLARHPALPRTMTDAMARAFNRSQQRAIVAALPPNSSSSLSSSSSSPSPFALIFGPPGTGKTAAIVGVVSALLEAAGGGRGGGAGASSSLRRLGSGALMAQQQQLVRQVIGGGGDQSALVQQQQQHAPRARVLVCAQSNAAVDEIVARLAGVSVRGGSGDGGNNNNQSGVWRADGRRSPATVVRLGRPELVRPSVAALHLDALADARAQAARRAAAGARAGGREGGQQQEGGGDDRATPPPPAADPRSRRDLRRAVILSAEVVACTLSGAGGDLLSLWPAGHAPAFDAVVVDEAAQALEPAALIPLQLLRGSPAVVAAAASSDPAAAAARASSLPPPAPPRIVLVGDPRQLPPTVLSRAAGAAELSRSLFERLQRCGAPATMLRTQYRMHPSVSAFPRALFYGGQLADGVSAEERAAAFHADASFAPYVVWDVRGGRERRGGGYGGGGGPSLINPQEAEAAARLWRDLCDQFGGGGASGGGPRSVAVVTPYRAQLSALRAAFRSALGRGRGGEDPDAALARMGVEFGTVDGFQGREADVVIFSAVRAQQQQRKSLPPQQQQQQQHAPAHRVIGFLADARRMNVALTRARRALWVLCHAATLERSGGGGGDPLAGSGGEWAALLRDARDRGALRVWGGGSGGGGGGAGRAGGATAYPPSPPLPAAAPVAAKEPSARPAAAAAAPPRPPPPAPPKPPPAPAAAPPRPAPARPAPRLPPAPARRGVVLLDEPPPGGLPGPDKAANKRPRKR
jgi:hypothetical protein